MVRGKRKLRGDFLEGGLSIRKSELVSKEGSFGRSSIGSRTRNRQSRVNKLLRLLYQVGEVKHCVSKGLSSWAIVSKAYLE